jgi:hypothetical protein
MGGQMKTKFSLILAALLLFVALAPAQAGTWRSTSGNMFHFYPGGSMEAYVSGNAYSGRWWWTNNPYQFQYNFGWNTITVNIKGQGAVALEPGRNPNYWTQMATRGGKTDKPDTESWFMEQVDP